MNKKKKEKDFLVFTLCFQSLICILIFLGLYLLRGNNSRLVNTISEDYFNHINETIGNASEYKPDGLKPTEVVLEVDNTVQAGAGTEGILSAEVYGSGGKDYGISSAEDVPSNVSVNTFTLSKQIVLPLEGEITSSFGARIHPVYGNLSFHAGVDIAGDVGEPILSAFDGQVVVADYDQWNGYYIKLVHDGGIMTVYCHCDELYVKSGDIVRAGDIIAAVGSTGSSTGPHLHFELRIDDVSYDPEIAFEDASDEA